MTILHMLKAGDHVAAMDDCYGGTYRYFTKIATPMGLNFSFADFSQEGEVEKILTDKTKVLAHTPHTHATRSLDRKT
jgi:cystathionine gamma-lyase